MWYLLYNIVRAGNKFERLNQKIGDVNPHNVIINDDGQIKVISVCSIPNELNNFEKIVQDKNAKVYLGIFCSILAPQQLNQQAINKGIYPSNVDPCKAQVFSIGLTILSSGILQDCFDIYNKGDPRTINDNILNQFIGLLRQNYSPYLCSTVTNMLSHPNSRKKSSEIYNQLLPYQQSILDLQHFTPYTQPGMHGSIHHPQQPQVQPQMSQSLNQQQTHPYLSQNQPINYAYNSGYMPSSTTTYIQSQHRNVYQETVPTIYKK